MAAIKMEETENNYSYHITEQREARASSLACAHPVLVCFALL